MTDHADTIRRALVDHASWEMHEDDLAAAVAALDALLAERQQAIDERDAAENQLAALAATDPPPPPNTNVTSTRGDVKVWPDPLPKDEA